MYNLRWSRYEPSQKSLRGATSICNSLFKASSFHVQLTIVFSYVHCTNSKDTGSIFANQRNAFYVHR